MAKRRYLATISAKDTRVCGYLKCKRQQEAEGLDKLTTLVVAKASELLNIDECRNQLSAVAGKQGQQELLGLLRDHAPQVVEVIENAGDFCLVVWAEKIKIVEPLNNTVH